MKVSNMLKLGIVLAAYAAGACVLLAFVYTGTAPVIAERAIKDQKEALGEIFPGADNFSEDISGQINEIISKIKIDDKIKILNAFDANANGSLIGTALIVSYPGYDGPITLIAGINNGFVAGVKIISHSETPGLGANADNPKYVNRKTGKTFLGQFSGKEINDKFTVDAITASTITSNAVANAVKAAGFIAGKWLEYKGGGSK